MFRLPLFVLSEGGAVMAKRKENDVARIKANLEKVIRKRDTAIKQFAEDFATALYDEGIATKLSQYGKRDIRKILHLFGDDLDSYIEKVHPKKVENMFAIALDDDEFNRLVAQMGTAVESPHNADEGTEKA